MKKIDEIYVGARLLRKIGVDTVRDNIEYRNEFFDILGELRSYANPDVYGLDSEETLILRKRMGILNEKAYTLEELAKEFGVSASYIRNREKKAYRKLRLRIYKGYFNIPEAVKVGHIRIEDLLNTKFYYLEMPDAMKRALLQYTDSKTFGEILKKGIKSLDNLKKNNRYYYDALVNIFNDLGLKFHDQDSYDKEVKKQELIKQKQELIKLEQKRIMDFKYNMGYDNLEKELSKIEKFLENVDERIEKYNNDILVLQKKIVAAINKKQEMIDKKNTVQNQLDSIDEQCKKLKL